MQFLELGRKALNRLATPIYLRSLMASQYLSVDELISIRTKKLEHILRLAVERVPRYTYLKREINFERFSESELQKFPIVTKENLRDDPQVFHADIFGKYFSHDYRTSGSSGNRFRFKVPFWSGGYEEAVAYRAWTMGKTYQYRSGESAVFLRTYAPKPGQSLHRYDRVHNYHYLSPFDINESSLEMYVDVIRRSKARLLRAYPSSIYLFTMLLKKHGIVLPQIETIVTASETLLPIYRSTVEEHWKVPVLDWYGQNERTVTIQQCWAGTYHNNDEYGIVEQDSTGQLIATSLVNSVMPFIRYATGDYALARNDINFKCPCGRSLSSPVLRIDGRSDDLLAKPDGTLVPTINIYTAMEKFEAIRQFSIVQNEDKHLDMVVSLNSPVEPEYLELVKAAVRQRAGDLGMDIRVVDEVPRDLLTQKQRAVRSFVPRA